MRIRNEQIQSKQLIPLGFLSKTFGLRGALWFKSENPQSETLRPSLSVVLKKGDQTSVRKISEMIGPSRICFEGIESRTEAETLQGSTLYVDRQDLPPIADNEVYLSDLLEFDAVDLSGKYLGQIVAFSSNGQQVLAVIHTKRGEEALVPFVPPLFQAIRESDRAVVFDLPEGLLP
jgi:16S rRNA processing protein RimM